MPKCMLANNNKLLQLFKLKTSQKTNDKLGGKYHSSQKANLSNNKGLQDIDKKKAHNPTEKWAKDTYIGSLKKKGNTNHR